MRTRASSSLQVLVTHELQGFSLGGLSAFASVLAEVVVDADSKEDDDDDGEEDFDASLACLTRRVVSLRRPSCPCLESEWLQD